MTEPCILEAAWNVELPGAFEGEQSATWTVRP